MPKRIKNQCQNWYRKRLGKSSKIMFLWRVKSLKFIGKTMVFDDFESFMCERSRYQKYIKNETKIHTKFNETSIQKTCLKKDSQNMKTLQKSDPKMEPQSIKNHSKNRCEKKTKKENLKLRSAEEAVSPNQSFQKTSFGVRCEESTLRKSNEGWVQSGMQKVKCKGKVQKGKCRQGTHYARKHARWLRPRADLWATASSADLRFCFDELLCRCVWGYAIVGLWDCEFVGWSDPKITPNMPKPTSPMTTLTET